MNTFGVAKDGHPFIVDIVPIMGNMLGMTLKEYIKSGASDIPTIAHALGVSSHAVHKWVYGQREPSLTTALEIVRLTGGKVHLHTLTKVAA